MNSPNRRHSGAFSSNEFLVLTAIFAILIAVLLPASGKLRQNARAATCTSNLGALMKAMYSYADDHGGTFAPPMDASLSTFPPPDRPVPQAANTWHLYLTPYVGWATDGLSAFNSGISWRSDSLELNIFTCPTSITQIHRLPEADGAHLIPWFMYGMNADLPTHALGVDRRSGRNIAIDDLQHPSQTMAILETLDWSAMYSREVTNTKFALIPHGQAANVAFYDGSVRRVHYEELLAHQPNSLFWAGGFAD